jgi:hypothetical protein
MKDSDKELSNDVDRHADVPPLDDETINRIADESFLEYDAREAEDAGRGQS